MSQRLQLLLNRVLPGRRVSEQAMKELCLMPKSPRISVDVLAVLLGYLSLKRPPPTGENGLSVIEGDSLGMMILECVTAALRTGVTGRTPELLFRRNWAGLYSWSSFYIDALQEPNPDVHEAIRVDAISVIAYLYWVVLKKQYIRPEEAASTPGAADTIVRLHLYALALDSYDTKEKDVALSASEILNAMAANWYGFWAKIHPNTINQVGPRMSLPLVKGLAQITLERELDYPRLNYWMHVLAVATRLSKIFNQSLLRHRTVYLVSHILRRISKNIVSPGSRLREQYLMTWKCGAQYLFDALTLGGYESINLALRSGLLLAIRRFSKASDNFLPHKHTTAEMYEDLLGLIAASSMYSSVQRCMQRGLSKLELDDAELGDLPGTHNMNNLSPSERAWFRVKGGVDSHVDMRCDWEDSLPKKCSYALCRPDNIKVRRCSGCLMAFYCSRNCQRMDWEGGHRESCQRITLQCREGLPRSAPRLDIDFIGWMLHRILWHIRDELLDLQRAYRDSQPSTDATNGVLINLVDFTSMWLEKSIWTVDEARTKIDFAGDTSWDGMIERLKALRDSGEEAGPIAVGKIPHPREPMYIPFVLTNPGIDEDETDVERSDDGLYRMGNIVSSSPMVRMENGDVVFPLLGMYTPSRST